MATPINFSFRTVLRVLVLAALVLVLAPGCHDDKGHRFPVDGGNGDDTPSTEIQPEISTISPDFGPLAGGNLVVVYGENFSSPCEVYFGENSASSVEVLNDQELSVSVPQGTETGSIDVTVQTEEGEYTKAEAYRYVLPVIVSITPQTGPAEGGTEVTISGSWFIDNEENTGVTLDGTALTGVEIVDDATITGMTPQHTAGTVDLAVENSLGRAELIGAFTYTGEQFPAPQLTGISPASGPADTGTQVTITGSGFSAPLQSLTLCGNSLLSITVVDDTTIEAMTPTGTAGQTCDLSIATSGGEATLEDAFTYNEITPPAPALSGITPASGAADAHTQVTITGSGFSVPLQSLTLCDTGLLNITVVDDGTIEAETPLGNPGETCDLVIVTDGGEATIEDAFTYDAIVPPAPTLTGINPVTGAPDVHTPVTITGSGFTAQIQGITLCGRELSDITVVDDTTIEAKTPLGTDGETCDLSITTAGGEATLEDAFTYRMPSAAEITILYPLCGITTAESITVEGVTTHPDEIVEIELVRGETIFPTETDDGFAHFSAIATLEEGENSFKVRMIDSMGFSHEEAAAFSVTRFASEPVDGPLGIAITPSGDIAYSDHIKRGIFQVSQDTGEHTVVNSPVPAWDIDAWGDTFDAVYIPELLSIPADGSAVTIQQLVRDNVFYALVRENDDSVLCTSRSTRKIWRLTPSLEKAEVVTDGGFEGDAALTAPRGLALLEDGRILTSDWQAGTIVAVEPQSGERTYVSGAGRGTGPELVNPDSIALLDADTLIVESAGEQCFYSVSISSGDRAVVSDAATGSGPVPLSVFDMETDQFGEVMLTDRDMPAVFSLDPETGSRYPLLNGSYGTGPKILRPASIGFSNDTLYAADFQAGALYSIDAATGNRALVSEAEAGSGLAAGHASDLALTGGYAYIAGRADARIIQVDLATGSRAVAAAGGELLSPAALCTNEESTLFIADSEREMVFRLALPAAGDPQIVSGPETGSGPALVDISGITASGGYIFASALNGAVIRIDPDTGDRQEILGAGTEFTMLSGIHALNETTVLLVALDGIFLLNHESGQVTPLTEAAVRGTGPQLAYPKAAAVDSMQRIFVLDGARKASFQVQKSTGDRVLLSR